MIVHTETDISHYEQANSFSRGSSFRNVIKELQEWRLSEGHKLLSLYRYEKQTSAHTVIGLVSEL